MKNPRWRSALICWLLLPLVSCAQVIELVSPDDASQANGRFGYGVKGISDLTGDGIGELAVSTTESIEGVAAAGSVYILSGQDFSVVRRLVSPQPTSSSNFGSSITEAPDSNGDKIPEIIVAAQREDRVYVFSGASGEVLQTLFSPDSQPISAAHWAEAVAALGAGQPNSMPFVAISSPGADPEGSALREQGTAAKIHFFNLVTGELQFTVDKPDNKRWFGASLATIGDVDGDGREDLAVGAGPAVPPYGPGAAYILSGGTGKVLHELIPPQPGNFNFRWDIAAVPDVNGDGKTDVLVGIGGGARAGAPTQSGHAYLFSGADGKLLRSLASPAEKARGGFGWSVAGVPDVTGDGAGELLIGAGTNPNLTGFETYGERQMYLINGATGQTIQWFASPYTGESMGWNITVLRGKEGKLRNLIAGVRREKSLRGRVFAFSIRKLSAAKSPDGCQVSLIATEEADHELQTSPDLQTWTTVTTLKAPATFLDKKSNGANPRFYRARQVSPSP